MFAWGVLQAKPVGDDAGIPENPRWNEEPFGQSHAGLEHECLVPPLGRGELRKPQLWGQHTGD